MSVELGFATVIFHPYALLGLLLGPLVATSASAALIPPQLLQQQFATAGLADHEVIEITRATPVDEPGHADLWRDRTLISVQVCVKNEAECAPVSVIDERKTNPASKVDSRDDIRGQVIRISVREFRTAEAYLGIHGLENFYLNVKLLRQGILWGESILATEQWPLKNLLAQKAERQTNSYYLNQLISRLDLIQDSLENLDKSADPNADNTDLISSQIDDFLASVSSMKSDLTLKTLSYFPSALDRIRLNTSGIAEYAMDRLYLLGEVRASIDQLQREKSKMEATSLPIALLSADSSARAVAQVSIKSE